MDEPSFVLKFGGLFSHYKREYIFYEIYEIWGRSALIMAITTVRDPTWSTQQSMIILAMIVFLLCRKRKAKATAAASAPHFRISKGWG